MTSNNEKNNIIFDDYKLKISTNNNDDYEVKYRSYVNFIKISILYMYYVKYFASNNKLYKHICESCLSKS